MATTTVKKATKTSLSSEQTLKSQATSSASQADKSPIVVQKAFNRSDLIQTLSEHVAISKKEAAAVLDTLKDIIGAPRKRLNTNG